MSESHRKISRRRFTEGAATLTAMLLTGRAPAAILQDAQRPSFPSGVMSGDVGSSSAILWARTDRPARMLVECSNTESFRKSWKARGPEALEVGDFIAKLRLSNLPPGERIFYRITFEDLTNPKVRSEPVGGSFQTAPLGNREITFAWSGDTAGQGFGINPDLGGMTIYETMRKQRPDFFIHSGDMIYADNPIPKTIELDDGRVWRNVTTEATSKVAESLAEFRGRYAYNLMDENIRRFHAEVPVLVQWDDHETVNNWYPGEILDDDRYKVKSCSLLSARGRRAFLDYNPIAESMDAPGRIHRAFHYGPSLDVMMLDMRSYRGANSPNRQKEPSPASALLGKAQIRWLKKRLLLSRATWKVIASDMPLGLIVGDGRNFENAANGEGPPLGRELEIADLLRFIRANEIRNVVWLTADVHYASAHYYDPQKAVFSDFDPFWEFVAGPLNAGTFGPGTLDPTFGPQVKFCSIPKGLKPNRPPTEGYQFFGTVRIDKEKTLTVSLWNAKGEKLHAQSIIPAGRG